MSIASTLSDAGGRALAHLGQLFNDILLSPGSTFSILSLGMAAMISVAFLVIRRKRSKRLRLRTLWRALFPKRIWWHASTRADLGYILLNLFITSNLLGWAILSGVTVRNTTTAVLTGLFGAPPAPVLPGWLSGTLFTVALFLAYDFAYWLHHYVMHRVSWLWQFHRVHHTAEVLTPMTAARMHPVDLALFFNVSALIIGSANGLLNYGLGGAHEAVISGTNIILVLFLYTIVQLQHSHIRLAFTGIWGRIIFSPAHHHVHHSDDPRHYNTNLGSCLAIWDGMFGTLVVPEPDQRLSFGAGPAPEGAHSAVGGLIHPFVQSAKILTQPLRSWLNRPAKDSPQAAAKSPLLP